MVSLKVSRAEVESGVMSPAHVATAVQALREDGAVMLEDVINLDHIAVLKERVMADVDRFVNRPDAPFNWNRGNVQQDPPPFPPYLFRDILANDMVIAVTREILGAGLFNAFYSGNTAMPSDQRQPVHADSGQLWPNLEVAHPPYALVVNFGLVEMAPENGSTELWLGTHRDTSVVMSEGDIKVSPERLEARRAERPPFQPTVPLGAMVIRDIRLWHAGMPNRTQTPRPMLAMIHNVGWWSTGRFKLHRSAEELLQHPVLRQHAEYTDEPIDYVSTPSAYEFTDK